MKNIGYPVNFARLNDTVTADGLINYFSFAECFSELLDAGNVKPATDYSDDSFIITSQGVNVVDNLLDMLIPSVRRVALAAATRLVSFEQRGAKIDFESKIREDGKYDFSFKVQEKNKPVFTLDITLESKEQLERIEYNFAKNPDGIYKSIMALLSGQANYILE